MENAKWAVYMVRNDCTPVQAVKIAEFAFLYDADLFCKKKREDLKQLDAWYNTACVREITR